MPPVEQSVTQTDTLSELCTPGAKSGRQESLCATPEARAAAAHLLRGLGLTQSLSLELGFDLEPEWPACPPPSLAASPLVNPGPASTPLALPAELVKTLNMGIDDAQVESNTTLEPELSFSSVEGDSLSPEKPRGPHPTPSAPRPCTFTLDAEDIVTAFSLAHEQLRTTPVIGCKQAVGTPSSSPVLQSQEAAAAAVVAADEVSPVVKTTRQVSSVLAAVAELEAAQGVTSKRKVARPFSVGASRFLPPSSVATTPASRVNAGTSTVFPPSSVDRTPANRVSTRFFQSPAMTTVVPAELGAQDKVAAGLSNVANPLFSQSNVANPLFSPLTSSPDPMLTPFYTPASMGSIRTGFETPASRGTFGGKENLAVGSGTSPAGLATPASGVVAGDWRSVTDRLQALRAQLQSAQKKLKATSEVSSPTSPSAEIMKTP